MNILFAGVGYFPFRVCGDKNYFVELLPLFAQSGHNVFVFSLNDYEPPVSRQKCGNSSISIYNIKRSLHMDTTKYQLIANSNLRSYHHKHPVYQEIPEIFITFLLNYKLLKKIIVENNIQIINFMDNCGPAMRFMQIMFPACKVCYSAMNYNPRLAFYDSYLKFSLCKLSHIIPYSKALMNKFLNIGIKKENMTFIPWGVNKENRSFSENQIKKIRKKYMLSPTNLLFLWTGFIQQIGENDFGLTFDLAHKVVNICDNVEFIFSFKPECQSVGCRYFSNHGRVKIIDKVDDFMLLLASSDYLLSPVASLDSILAPPLTWVESMKVGTPVITTAAGGSDEIISDGVTGFIGENYNALIRVINHISSIECHKQMRQQAKLFVEDNYEISKSANQYSNMYREIMNKDE